MTILLSPPAIVATADRFVSLCTSLRNFVQ